MVKALRPLSPNRPALVPISRRIKLQENNFNNLVIFLTTESYHGGTYADGGNKKEKQ